MIKNYKIFTESLLNKLEGPSDDELFKTYNSSNYDELLLSGIWDDNEDVVKYAIEQGVDIKQPNVLYIAVINDNLNIVRMLLDNGAEPSYNNYNILSVAYQKHNQDMIDLILQYVDKKSYSYRDYIGDVD